jgi:hypothetical protein
MSSNSSFSFCLLACRTYYHQRYICFFDVSRLPFFQSKSVAYSTIFPSLQVQNEGRLKVREALKPESMQMALQRVISFPCKKQYTVVILMPKPSRWNSLISVVSWSSGGFSRDAKVRYSMPLFTLHLVTMSVFENSSTCADFGWHGRHTGLSSQFMEILTRRTEIVAHGTFQHV